MVIRKKLAVICAASIVLSVFSGCSSSSNELRIGTGGIGGVYYEYGNILSEAVSEDNENISIQVKTTAGSAASLRLIKEEFLDLAIVQNDVLQDAVEGTDEFADNQVTNVRAVAGLYTEVCQIVTAADSGIETVEDLEGKRVSIGEEESGVETNAEQILTSAGMSLDDIEVSQLSFADSAEALENGEIDAFFVVAGLPTVAVTQLCENMDLNFISLDERLISILKSLYPGYSESTIPAGTYEGQTEDIVTVGIKAVLVASSTADDSAIEAVTAAIFDHASDFEYATYLIDGTDLSFAVEDISASFHDGAAAYYATQNITVETSESDGTSKTVNTAVYE